MVAAPMALIPFLYPSSSAQAAANLDSFTPMDALKDKDYGKPRVSLLAI